MQPRALILHADGINRDLEAAQALELAGAQPDIVHINQLRAKEKRWEDYQLLVVPGGFSYADALGAGRLLAIDLNVYFADQAKAFVESGKPVIGICNGFQALVKAGILPASQSEVRSPKSEVESGKWQVASKDRQITSHESRITRLQSLVPNPQQPPSASNQPPTATLTFNACGHFECRWVTLAPRSQTCVWTRGLSEPICCPVAHGEGRFVLSDPALGALLKTQDQIALTYARADGSPALGAYPENPNGSIEDIAGLCNPRGNVLGLMPHPEDHVYPFQHPRWTRGETNGLGLNLFVNGVQYAAQL
jgi:phosphoribosylformylglycinamidine synthase I